MLEFLWKANKYIIQSLTIIIFSNTSFAAEEEIEEIIIVGDRLFRDTTDVSPTSVITVEDLTAINMSTVEDALMYEPNLIIRRRFIGDPNGVIGMRGSNMFQGSRTMVFADGMPLHYHLSLIHISEPTRPY